MPATAKAFGYNATRIDTAVGKKLVVHNVAIFCECERDGQVYDSEWIEKAVEKSKARAADNYYPPLHVMHHKPGANVRAAGYFEVTGTGTISMKGKRKLAVFADLIITNPDVIDAVMMEQTPYVSIEVFDLDKPPSIDGLALLDHNAPFNELPMLMVADVQDGTGNVSYETIASGVSFQTVNDDGPLVAFAQRGSSAFLLFEGSMADEPKEGDGGGDDKPAVPVKEESGSGPDMQAVAQYILSGGLTMAEKAVLIDAMTKAGLIPQSQAMAPQMPAPQQQVVQAPGAAMQNDGSAKTADMAQVAEVSAQFAALTTANEVLSAKLRAIEEKAAIDADVKVAMQKLEGRPMGADLEARLTERRALFGAEKFKIHVEDMANAVPIPRFQTRPEQISERSYPAVVMQFAKEGPEKLEIAANLADEFEMNKRAGMGGDLESYIRNNMAKASGIAVNGQAGSAKVI